MKNHIIQDIVSLAAFIVAIIFLLSFITMFFLDDKEPAIIVCMASVGALFMCKLVYEAAEKGEI
jgi:hypothetical protein